MTDRHRQRVEVALLALLFGAGAGWGAFQLKMSYLAEKLERIDQRVTALYCAQVPANLREACR